MSNPVLSIENVLDNPHIKWNVAKNQTTPVETLKVLATDEDYCVRMHIARNPNTPIETLKVLATDKNKNVRRCVADNPNTPAESSSITKAFVPMKATKSKNTYKARDYVLLPPPGLY